MTSAQSENCKRMKGKHEWLRYNTDNRYVYWVCEKCGVERKDQVK